MRSLNESLLLELVDNAYCASLDPSRWSPFLETLSEAFKGNSVLFSQDQENAAASVLQASGFDSSWFESYKEHYASINPWLKAAANDPEGRILIGAEQVEPSSFKRSEYYNDWLRPQGLREGIGAIVMRNETVSTHLSVVRRKSAGYYTKGEIQFWRALAPHVRRAVQIHHMIFEARLHARAALLGLNRLSVGALIVDASSRLLFRNEVAERILSSGVGLATTGGRVRGETLSATRTLHALIASAAATGAGCGTDAGGVVALPRRSGGALSALVSPLRMDDDVFQLCCPTALVFISEPKREEWAKPKELMTIFGLTRAEARLLCGLLNGATLADYALSAGVTVGTVRTQLKQLFAKVGVNSQSELMRVVLANPVVRMSTAAEPRPKVQLGMKND